MSSMSIDFKYDYPSYEWEPLKTEPEDKATVRKEDKRKRKVDAKPKIDIWKLILLEYEEQREDWNQVEAGKKLEEPPAPERDSVINYLNKEVFSILLPAIEKTIIKAQNMDCIKHQKSKFNGLDYIAELLWNSNPRHPERIEQGWKEIFSIPFVKQWLKHNPRPIYPKSWLWSREEAAILIQAYYRGHLVRRKEEVQEMRIFWKALAKEKKESHIKEKVPEGEEFKKRPKECIM